LSKVLLDSVSRFFRPQVPRWACEFTSRHLILVGVDSSRKRIASKTAEALAPKMFTGSSSEKNFADESGLLEILKETIRRAGLKGSEVSVVVPDDASRITFVNAESLPAGREERETFVRWKLKKNMPFDVDAAQVAFKVLDHHKGNGKGVDLIIALSPRPVIEEYENLMQKVDLHAGYVVPSTLAALNAYSSPKDDALVVKMAPDCITTTIFQKGIPRFYRRVAEMPLFDAVYPTVMYYQDKLGGGTLAGVYVCGYERDIQWEFPELQNKLRAPVRRFGPETVEDIYKPALGAVNFVWANLV
jgi:hypothetical protein